jgi:sarcosine oxidase
MASRCTGKPGVKEGKFIHVGNAANSDNLDRLVSKGDTDVPRAFIQQYFPDAAGPIIKATRCMVTNSPGEHFVIGLHDNFPQGPFSTGFSGHGVKLRSTVGEVMADVAKSPEISLLAPRRLKGLPA